MGLGEQQARLPDGRILRCVVSGSGGPLVVFEAGIGAGASMWAMVQELVAKQTHTLAYDRAGYGASSDDRLPRSVDRLAADLGAMLETLELKTPAVLVGSSLGALILHRFANAYPERVAGMILIDPAVGDILQRRQLAVIRTIYTVLAALSYVGLQRPLWSAVMRPTTSKMPPVEQARLMHDLCAKHTVRTAAREAYGITGVPTLTELLAGLPEVPVVAMLGEQADRGEAKERAAMADLFRNVMQTYPGGQFVPASHSGHFTPWQQPGLVAETILRMVDTVRRTDA
jgi:pimeloyl-ACP methyl ester carboxylesterase